MRDRPCSQSCDRSKDRLTTTRLPLVLTPTTSQPRRAGLLLLRSDNELLEMVAHRNIPDLRGYMLAGKDDMGGSAANRITNGGSGIIGTTLGATGGLETHTLTTAQLPTVTPAGSVSGTPTGTVSVANQTLTTNIRNENIVTATTGTITQETVSIAVPASQATGSDTTVPATAPTTATSSATGLGASFTGTPFGSGNAHNNMPPTRICNFLMRIL